MVERKTKNLVALGNSRFSKKIETIRNYQTNHKIDFRYQQFPGTARFSQLPFAW